MKKCEHCGTRILFGPVRDQGHIFCNARCRDLGVQTLATSTLPEEFIREKARQVHAGPCPKCQGDGPVDVHTAHYVWSMFIMTSTKSLPEVCCARCGRWSRWKAIGSNALFGWWGIPWGLVFTPAQILRNLGGARVGHEPSDKLVQVVRSGLAAQLWAASAEQRANVGEK